MMMMMTIIINIITETIITFKTVRKTKQMMSYIQTKTKRAQISFEVCIAYQLFTYVRSVYY